MRDALSSVACSSDVRPVIPLLATKLYVPPTRPGLVSRPRLLERLGEGPSARLILISAPAGFGKTTLVTEWLADEKLRAAWISLDQGDNDLARFFGYVIAALQTTVPEIGRTAQGLLHGPQVPPVESILTLLVNELCTLPGRLVLVFDDYQAIDAPLVHTAVSFLLDSLPPQVQIVIATRVDPPLPLARLRSRGLLVEIRAEDLRFSRQEAATFLNQGMGLCLSAPDIARLEDRTEGWIAGLQMAALFLQGRQSDEASNLIQAFSGSYHYILDYLMEEVLSRQPEQVQAFLVQTSILERLSGPLCDALTGQTGGQATLEQLDKANLFLVPLDHECRWYRYHHLFADLLRARLQQSQPDLNAPLHLRAAEWYERQGLVSEAVTHALAARDFERATRLVDHSVESLFARGEFTTVLAWIDALPRELARSRPWLCIHHAWVLMYSGQLDDAESLLQNAEQQILSSPLTPGARDMLGNIAITRADIAEICGDVRRTIQLACLAREHLSPNNLASGHVGMVLGLAYLMGGSPTLAYDAFSDAKKLSESSGNVFGVVRSLCYLAQTCKIQGRLNRAADLYKQALHLAAEHGERFRLMGPISLGLGDLAYEWNDLESARRHVLEGIEHYQRWGSPNARAGAYATLAGVLQALGDTDGASDALDKAEQVILQSRVHLDTSSLIESRRVRLWLAQGNLKAADRWLTSKQGEVGGNAGTDLIRELQQMTQARVLIAQDKSAEAAGLLTGLAEVAESSGRIGRLIEILVLQALAEAHRHDLSRRRGDTAPDLTALRKCLLLAEPEGYLRVFLDGGTPIAALLRRLATQGVAPDYVRSLLTAFEACWAWDSSDKTGLLRPVPLIEPLSARELEVLQLVADGLTNQEIAERLTVVVGTVKAHVHHIYGKLDATSRAQAIAHARELKLV